MQCQRQRAKRRLGPKERRPPERTHPLANHLVIKMDLDVMQGIYLVYAVVKLAHTHVGMTDTYPATR